MTLRSTLYYSLWFIQKIKPQTPNPEIRRFFLHPAKPLNHSRASSPSQAVVSTIKFAPHLNNCYEQQLKQISQIKNPPKSPKPQKPKKKEETPQTNLRKSLTTGQHLITFSAVAVAVPEGVLELELEEEESPAPASAGSRLHEYCTISSNSHFFKL